MNGNNNWGTQRSSGVKIGVIVRLGLALFATLGSIALTWTLLNSHHGAHASGLVEVSTKTKPWGVALDTQGHIWVAEPGCKASPQCGTGATAGAIGEYNTADASKVADFTPPSTKVYIPVFLVVDASGNVWFTDPTHNAIGKLVPSTKTWTEYTTGITANSAPRDLVLDSHGNLWFTESLGNNIGFFNTSNQTVVETPIPTAGSDPYGITITSSGTAWFAENAASNLGSFTPNTTGTITISEKPIGSTLSPIHAHMITSDASGNLWYSEGASDAVGEFTPSTSNHQDFSTRSTCATPPCPGSFISGIGTDSKGKVWFSDDTRAVIGQLDPTTGTVSPTVLTSNTAYPHDGLIVDSNNNVWFAETDAIKLGELPSGTVTPPTPTPTGTTTGTPSPTPTGTPTGTPNPGGTPVSKIWYFAEGKVGQGFTEYITIENPDASNACSVNLQYLLNSGGPVTKTVSVPPNSRFTEGVNSDLSTMASSSSYLAVSTIVQVNSTTTPNCNGVVAERPMYFTNFTSSSISSGTDVVGATHTGTSFYFADMPTVPGYNSFITILNPPGGSTANITATYYQGGNQLAQQILAVPAGTRGTINPTLSQNHMNAVITSDQPVVIERPSYFNVSVQTVGNVKGSASVVGSTSPASDWNFAEGYTGGGFQEYLVLGNFGTTDANTTIVLEYDNGHTQTVQVNVPHEDVAGFDINALNAHPLGTCDTNPCQVSSNVSAEITTSASTPIVAEREMFFHYNNNHGLTAMGGTDVTGLIAPTGSAYSFAEGYTNVGYNEWLTLQNPTTSSENINLTLVNENGQTYQTQYQVVAKSRFTVDITGLVSAHLAPAGSTYPAFEVSMVVQSVGNALFVAERPMYFNTGSSGTQGGHDVIGYLGN